MKSLYDVGSEGYGVYEQLEKAISGDIGIK
jgi:hypothetical protein